MIAMVVALLQLIKWQQDRWTLWGGYVTNIVTVCIEQNPARSSFFSLSSNSAATHMI